MFRCLRSATESLRNLGKISVSLGMSYILKIGGIRTENPVTGLFLMNWLQIPSRDSWSLSSFIHSQFCCKCTFILCPGWRLQLSTRISPNEDIYKHLYEPTSQANGLAWPSGWHKWDCISPLVGVSCTAGPCRPEKGPTFDTVFDETLHPASWELLCMPAAFILATWEAKFVVKHICGKCTACK